MSDQRERVPTRAKGAIARTACPDRTASSANNYTFPMEPNRFGRKLGIGVRVASRMVKERAAQANNQPAAAQTTTPPPPPRPSTPPPTRPPIKNYAEPARRVGVGTRRFGQAFFGPLKHISGTLWLEITGLFFALFAVFFGQNAWRTRASALHGAEHAHFLLYAVVTLVFLYFCVSSFVKASRRGKRMAR
ncbi:MAG: hypothetical protein WBQ79_07355 [Acidobacteriaceae bacterium]